MADIKSSDLIAKFEYFLKQKYGYIFGQAGAMWTQAKQDALVKTFIDKYGKDWKNNSAAKNNDKYLSALYGAKWIGHHVTDCSGAFSDAFKQLGGTMYHGSNTMWNSWCVFKGELRNGKRTDGQELKPGTAVFTYNAKKNNRGHVGLYIGNGSVIEAKGTQAGVIMSKVTESKWVEYGELKGVVFNGTPSPSPTPEPEPSDIIGQATVTAVKVALRSSPSTQASVITRVDINQKVNIIKDEWTHVEYNGKKGYMMSKFLKGE